MCEHCYRNWLGMHNIKWGSKHVMGFKRDWLIGCRFRYNEYRDPRSEYYNSRIGSNPNYSKWNRHNDYIPKEHYNKRYRQW